MDLVDIHVSEIQINVILKRLDLRSDFLQYTPSHPGAFKYMISSCHRLDISFGRY
jgi:hypothetical protein